MTILDGKALRLELGELSIDFDDWDIHGLACDSVDLGFPDVREVLTDLPGQDGQYDETQYFGTRVITLTGSAGPTEGDGSWSRSRALNALAPFLAPNARPNLVVALDDDVYERRFTTLRIAQYSGPVANGSSVAFSVAWKCSDPLAYALTAESIELMPSSASDDVGRTYPLAFPRIYPPGYGDSGERSAISAGNYQTFPVIQFVGPCSDPKLTWLDPVTKEPIGIQVVVTGLDIDAGDFLEIDTKAQTVLLNGDPGANRYSFIDFGATNWGPLQPGDNLLFFQVSAAASPASCQVTWSDSFLL